MARRPTRDRSGQRRGKRGPAPPPLRPAVLYARVSSRDQEREGFSIPAQQKLLRAYAVDNGFEIVQEFTDIETAKRTGRGAFNKMMTFIRKRKVNPPVVLVEKTDRLYRNLKDWVTVDELGVEVHLVKEGVAISEESRSSEKFMHGIKVLMAKNYVDNLSEEVRKGMRHKAEEGHWPSSAPVGYLNRREGGKSYLVKDAEKALLVRNLFERYGSGKHSLKDIAAYANQIGLRGKRGGKLYPSTTHNILRNPIYVGEFWWGGKLYESKDPTLITRKVWDQVQARLDGHHDTRPARQEPFAFAGLLKCGHCSAAITMERHKGKYVYYRCAQKCRKEKYTREEKLAEMLGERVVKPLQMTDEMSAWAIKALRSSKKDIEREQERRLADARRRFDRLRGLIDAAYEDKLAGQIDAAFFARKKAEWERGMFDAHEEIEALTRAGHRTMDTAVQVIELANRAYSLYFQRSAPDQRKLLDIVLSNCTLAAGEVEPTYRKAFKIIAEMVTAGNEQAPGSWDPGAVHTLWSGREDSNLRLPAPKAGALPGCATPRWNQPAVSSSRIGSRLRSARPRWLIAFLSSGGSSAVVRPRGSPSSRNSGS